MDVLVIGSQLQLPARLPHRQTLEGLALRGRHFHSRLNPAPAPPLRRRQRPHKRHQRSHLRRGQRAECRHAPQRGAGFQEVVKILFRASLNTPQNRRTMFATVAIRPVASGTKTLERLLSIRNLSPRHPHQLSRLPAFR